MVGSRFHPSRSARISDNHSLLVSLSIVIAFPLTVSTASMFPAPSFHQWDRGRSILHSLSRMQTLPHLLYIPFPGVITGLAPAQVADQVRQVRRSEHAQDEAHFSSSCTSKILST